MNLDKFEYFIKNGYNCSQTVLCYFAEDFNLDNNVCKRISEAFESGMFSGEVCGAVSGAYMVLGLKFGSDSNDHREIMQSKVLEFREKYKERLHTITCRELLGEDISTEKGIENILNQGLLEKVCPVAIKTSIEILEDMLK